MDKIPETIWLKNQLFLTTNWDMYQVMLLILRRRKET